MKPHPEMKIDEILEMIKTAPPESHRRIDGTETPEEKVKSYELFKEAAKNIEEKVLVHCVGCGETTKIRESTPCICGQFVCDHCRKIEEEGVCEHERSEFADGE